MNTRTTFFFLLAILCVALSAASAQPTLFTSGPINGNLNAFFIDGPGGPWGMSVSDGFVATATGTAAVPQVDKRKDDVAFRCGQVIMDVVRRGLKPREIGRAHV